MPRGDLLLLLQAGDGAAVNFHSVEKGHAVSPFPAADALRLVRRGEEIGLLHVIDVAAPGRQPGSGRRRMRKRRSISKELLFIKFLPAHQQIQCFQQGIGGQVFRQFQIFQQLLSLLGTAGTDEAPVQQVGLGDGDCG